MAGMPGMILDPTLTYPAIGLIFAVGLCFYAVAVLNQMQPLKSQATDDAPSASSSTDGGSGLFLAPRSVDACRIVIVLVLAYAILSKLV